MDLEEGRSLRAEDYPWPSWRGVHRGGVCRGKGRGRPTPDSAEVAGDEVMTDAAMGAEDMDVSAPEPEEAAILRR